jgi:hypothetical protein
LIIGDMSSGDVYYFTREGPLDSTGRPIGADAIDTTRCATCKVYHVVGAPHECAPQIEEPKS